MSIRHETLELNNLLLSKYRDEDTMGYDNFIIFAINQEENTLVGANIVNFSDVQRTKEMAISLRKYKMDEIMISPKKLEEITDEDNEKFDENITLTVSYFLNEGFQFPNEWDKVSFNNSKPIRGCVDNKCGDCRAPP